MSTATGVAASAPAAGDGRAAENDKRPPRMTSAPLDFSRLSSEQFGKMLDESAARCAQFLAQAHLQRAAAEGGSFEFLQWMFSEDNPTRGQFLAQAQRTPQGASDPAGS